MDELIKSIYTQAGALGLLAASGWILWWFERKERLKVQQKRDELLETILTFMHDQKDSIEKISEGLAVQDLIRSEMSKYRDRDARQ